MEDAINKLVNRLETVTARLEKVEKQLAAGGGSGPAPASGGSAAASGDLPASVQAFSDLVSTHIGAFKEACGKVGAELPELAALVDKVLAEHQKIIHTAALSKKPADADLQKLFTPMLTAAGALTAFKDKKESRSSKNFNHICTLAEAMPCLNWVAITPAPVPYLNETIGGSEFYSNRILKDFKGKDDNHVAFVTGFNGFLKGLQAYVKQYHTTGLVWNNAKGGNALEVSAGLGGAASSGGAAAPPPPAGGPPPPGPPPPGPPPPSAGAGSSSGKGDPSTAMSSVFAQLNSGDVTSGLKKVTNDMKSKNRKDQPALEPKKAGEPKPRLGVHAAAQPKKGPPKCELVGNKWQIENQSGNETTVDATDFKQTVYIYKCENAVVKINGKITSLAIDGCKKTAVIFDNAIASLEIVNGNSVKVQINGAVPSIAVDKTSGYQLYLSKDCLHADIITSKSDEGNVVIPNPKPGEDPIEMPVPEQYISKVVNNSLHTTTVKHTGV